MSCACVMSERPTSDSMKNCEDHRHLYQPIVETLVGLLRDMQRIHGETPLEPGENPDPEIVDWYRRVNEALAKWRL